MNRKRKLRKKKLERVMNLQSFIDFQATIDAVIEAGGSEYFLLETDSFSKVTANRIKLEFHNNNNKNDLAYSIIESDDEENGRIVIEKNVDNPDPNNPRKTVRITFADAELDKIDPLVNWDLLGNGSSSTVAGKFRFNYINHIDGRVVNALFIPDDLDTYNIVSKSQFLPN